MKYGETLQQRSIPAWSHHNIDYDDIKHFIKERTTPGQGKAICIPGRGVEDVAEFEDELFTILRNQHSRIDLFVRSKAGEIKRRVGHAKKQLRELSSRKSSVEDRRIPITRLERYSKLENDLLKAGEEIKSLARFISTQRTAFRKLLKKYKKWTGSPELEERFNKEILDQPKSFTKLDLGPLLDEYSETLQSIRGLYETRLRQTVATPPTVSAPLDSSPSTQFQSALASKFKVEFDTAIATIPLGEGGSLAYYFVHPDNVVELQVLLLQHLDYYTPRSRSNSTILSELALSNGDALYDADYFTLVADNLDRFARNQSSATIKEREHLPGLPPQRTKISVRWNNDEEPILSARLDAAADIKTAPLKKKHINTFFDSSASLPKSKHENRDLATIRDEMLGDGMISPLYMISSCRSRFIGRDTNGLTLATLDTSVSMQKADETSKFTFKFAVLHVRQECAAGAELLSILDRTHLAERVRGFSLHYHALWQLYELPNIAQPIWIPILSQDLRKLPPPALKSGESSAAGSSGTQTASRRSDSLVDSTTAVETMGQSSSSIPEQLETPPLKSFRKKRRRPYAESKSRQQQQYWSEYDHPENGGDDTSDAYVIYCNPNEQSKFDRLFDKVASFFHPIPPEEIPEEETLLPSPPLPEEEVSSSEDEESRSKSNTTSYGTIDRHQRRSNRSRHETCFPWSLRHDRHHHHSFPPLTTIICLIASIAFLVIAYILTVTSKHKFEAEADAGTLFAVGCSLVIAVVGCIPLLTRRGIRRFSSGVALAVLLLVAIGSGGMLARILG